MIDYFMHFVYPVTIVKLPYILHLLWCITGHVNTSSSSDKCKSFQFTTFNQNTVDINNAHAIINPIFPCQLIIGCYWVGERGLTVLSTKPRILFCDLRLGAGESRTCMYLLGIVNLTLWFHETCEQ